MSFENASAETRERFAECHSLLQFLKTQEPENLLPASENTKSLRGLWIVSIYSAVERAVNSITEAALEVISSQSVRSVDCEPPLHSLFHYAKVQSLRDCGSGRLFDRSVELFASSHSVELIQTTDNPLANSLQNVDATTMIWVLSLFGAMTIFPAPASVGRINALRQRRNAVAHGRESAARVGERYNFQELEKIYRAADEVVAAFYIALRDHCVNQKYLKAIA